jgi:CheY-like chemotaxis protein
MQNVFYIEDEDYVIDDLQFFYDNFKTKQKWHIEKFIIEKDKKIDQRIIFRSLNANNYDVIILDLNFHDKEWAGLELIEPIRKKYPLIPIIVCTVLDRETHRLREIFEKGVWDYLPKETDINPTYAELPSFIPILAEKIEKVVSSRYYLEKNNDTRVFHCPQWGTILLPRELIGHKDKMYDYLVRHSFEKNIFIMMKYRDSNQEHEEIIIRSIEKAGFHPVIAKKDKLTGDLYNTLACLTCSNYGIALLDQPEEKQVISPNVLYELGWMNSQGKKCLILKSKGLKKDDIPADITPSLYDEYNESNLTEIEQIVQKWISELDKNTPT